MLAVTDELAGLAGPHINKKRRKSSDDDNEDNYEAVVASSEISVDINQIVPKLIHMRSTARN